ncbi:MAG TPA: HAMP domain-containing sensor histidine kinase [Streptosporangiaceae bacterium]|nr:HAMP domain-containing sensor histidine kinase [Streptosporangiaceae bacterium]
MSRTRRLSLRARMLVMLIGVTTVLLLVMGTVSTYLLARRVDAQITASSAHLSAAAVSLARRGPQVAADRAYSGPAVAEIVLPGPPLGVTAISAGALTSRLAAALTTQLAGSDLTQARTLWQGGHLDTARQLLFGSGCGHFPNISSPACKPIVLQKMLVATRWVPAGRGRAALLFVGEQVTTGPGAVRGFIIAELITGTALIALLALAGEWLIGRGLIPLDEMTRTANEITSQGDLTARMPEADDQTEIGRLGSSINTMLDRIQQAFSSRLGSEQKVREFAADASHELRTPLTTIRGYAELYRQGALGPDQLPNAMRRIEQEAERMSTLVAELLELARLDRTSSLDLAETDLAGVVRDAVADAIAVEPRRPVHAEAPSRLVAVVDEPRIRQVLANLLGNVRAHTPETTPVAVRLGAITGGVLIEVADGGPGMSTQDAIRAFDRFHRATDRPSAAEAADAAGEDQDQGGNAADRASALPGRAAALWSGRGAYGAAARQAAVNGGSVNGASVNGVSGVNGASLFGAGVDAVAANGAAANGGQRGGPINGGTAGSAGRNGTGAGQGQHRATGGSGRAERTSGSGLGLSIVQAIANAHGGRATLESRLGQGTKVRVWLPVRIVP